MISTTLPLNSVSFIGPTDRRPKSTKIKFEHTAAGIRWSSPTQLLISRSEAYRWQSGRDAELVFSLWPYVLGMALKENI